MATLTSWKEIAHYLGKGVRTVQRWERLLGLPVRRPMGRMIGIVLADTREIDAWMLSSTARMARDSSSEIDRLQNIILDLLAENNLLWGELERLVGSEAIHSLRATGEALSSRLKADLEVSVRVRGRCEELAKISSNAHQLRFAGKKSDEEQVASRVDDVQSRS
jgi:hypothetical protein